MCKRYLILMLIFLNILPSLAWYPSSRPYDNNWYIRTTKSEYANSDRKYLDPPPVGEAAKPLNKVQRILLRSSKRHPSQWNRYRTHISNREYTDCSYYKYVDCSNFTFCRCWQCRDYAYPIVRTNY